jgi:hypothetical protein
MATTSNTYTGNGSNKLFSITFPYLDIGDIKVYLNNGLQTITTQYVFASITQIEFVTAPANGAVVDIRRETTIDTPEATFFIGSPVRANDLNDNNNQLLYLAQETQNSLDGIDAKAEDALDAVSAALPYTLVANLTALNALTPVLNSYYELNDSTGATTPTITSIPVGLVGSSGLTFRLRYNGTSFVFQNYFANDSETRYVKLTGGNLTGNLSVDTDVLFVDITNNRTGLNTATPEATLDIRSQGTTDVRGASGRHADNTTALSEFKWIGARSRGSLASPTAVLSNDSLVSVNGRGYKASAWSDTVGGYYVYAAENWTNTATGSYLTLRGCNTGGTVVSEWARMDQNGLLLTNQRDLRLGDSDNSNYVGFQSPATVSSNVVWTLPATDGTVDQALTTDGSGTLSFADRGRMVLATSQASTSGTSIDFTGLPSWVKRITVMFAEVSTTGSSNIQIQLGTTGGFVTTSYLGSSWSANSSNVTNSTGFLIVASNGSAARYNGSATISLAGSDLWVSQSIVSRSDTASTSLGSGSRALSGTLTQLRITTVNGTDTFDEGSINIMYEG